MVIDEDAGLLMMRHVDDACQEQRMVLDKSSR